MYLLVCVSGRISWCGFRMERPLSVDAKGKRQESSGGGRVSSSLWKRVMLAISLRQRNDGQLSCLNRSVLGVRKGARRMERATAASIRSMAMASRSRRLPCQTGDAYSSFGRRKYKYSCAVVAGSSTFDIHLRSPARGAALRRSSWMWSCQSRFRERTTPRCFVHGTTSIASFSMRSLPVCMLVDEVIIFVFAWPKRPRQEIAQFSAEVTASWSGDSDTSWLCWWAWCNRASSAYRSVCTRLMLQGRSFMKITKSTGPRCDPCGTPAEIGCGADWPSPTRTVMWRPDK